MKLINIAVLLNSSTKLQIFQQTLALIAIKSPNNAASSHTKEMLKLTLAYWTPQPAARDLYLNSMLLSHTRPCFKDVVL